MATTTTLPAGPRAADRPAIIGSIAATSYSGAMAEVPQPAARDSIGAAAQVVQQMQAGHAADAAQRLHATAADAFVHGAGLGVLIAAAIVLATAAITARLLRPARG